ncbi:MAG: PAS domain S-box protein [Chitinivibrionales bacterium]|nr:PAS domain S-box protein [Chitinivibrionales bacterium]
MPNETSSANRNSTASSEVNVQQILLDAFPCVALLLRPQTREIVASNKAAMEIGAVPGTYCFSIWGQRKDPCPWCLAPEVWKNKKEQHVETVILGVVWDVHWVPVSDELYMHYAFDITKRKRTEEALRESELRNRMFIENFIGIAYQTSHLTFRPFFFHGTIKEITGYTGDDFTSGRISWGDLIHPEDSDRVHTIGEKLRDIQGYVADSEYRIINKEGQIRWVRDIGRAIRTEDGQTSHLQGAIYDVTEYKQAEEALRCREQEFSTLIENAADMIVRFDANLHHVYCNPAVERCLGIPASTFLGKTPLELQYPQEEAELIDRSLRQVLTTGRELGVEQSFPTPFGAKHFHTRIVPEYDASGKIDSLLAITRDITERKLSEEALRRQKEMLEIIFDNVPVMIGFLDKEFHHVFVNRCWQTTFGWALEEAMHMDVLAEFYPDPAYREYVLNYITKAEGRWGDFKTKARDGRLLDTSWTNVLLSDGSNIGIGIDITERKRAEQNREKIEQRLNQTQKLDSLGILAGGIAHDFNNLLGGIFGYIDMALESSSGEVVANHLSKALLTIDRARGLTHQLLTFAKGGAPVQKIGALFPFVRETAHFSLSGSNVSCQFNIQKELWSCNFDKNQIGQVIDNIIINAQQAMPGGGTIEVSAENISFGEKAHITLSAGDYVKISVKDYGIGIPKEFLPHIFDPFYTTKAKGHGLGLTTCYSIIIRHGGCIDVESEPGKGSTFHIYLPAIKEAPPPSMQEAPAGHMGNGVFLVMDDEVAIRETIGGMLASFGYTVVFKENGKDAIDFFTKGYYADHKLVGMIFDLTIPGGIGGKEAIREIRKLNLNIPAFVVSGYAEDPVMADPAAFGFTASICKPFRITELAHLLSTHLKKSN